MSQPPAPPPVGPPEPGDPAEVGAYQVLGRLGQGGMGTVYLGRAADGTLAAIKVVHADLARDEEFRGRFAAEVTNARRVASFCTAQVLGSGEVGGRPYIATEFIDGLTLYQHVSEYGPLSPGTLHGVAVGVAAGLAAIHTAGLVHRDLKPANVILSVSGPRVIDFGIARALDSATQSTPTGFIVGSPGWIAPEQLLNQEIGTVADVFAWACLMGYAGSGRHPYGRGDAITMAARILHAEPDVGALPEPLHGLVRQALSADPSARPTALELMLALVGGTGAEVEQAASRMIERAWPASETPTAGTTAGTATGDAAGPGHLSDPGPDAPTPPAAPGAHASGDTAARHDVAEDAPARHDGTTAVTPETADTGPMEMTARLRPAPGEPSGSPPPASAPRAAEPPATTRPRRRRALVYGLLALAVVAAAGTVAVLPPWAGDDAAPFRAMPLGRGHPTGVGRPVHLGPVDMTVGRPRCGPRAFRGRDADGRFCLVPLVVANDGSGGDARTVRLTPRRLRLLDTSGGRRRPDAVVNGLTPGDTELPDGARVAGDLLFDVPRGADPSRLNVVTTEPHAAPEVSVWL